MKLLYFILTASLAGCFGCENDPELPPISTEGRNTFGCKVNGSIYVPRGGGLQGGSHNAEIVYESDTATLVIGTGDFVAKKGMGLRLFDTPDFDLSHNEYDLTNEKYRIGYSKSEDCDNCSCGYSKIESGFLKLLRYDKQENIISGTFEFTASSHNPNCPGIIKVTEGRFDMPFLPYHKN